MTCLHYLPAFFVIKFACVAIKFACVAIKFACVAIEFLPYAIFYVATINFYVVTLFQRVFICHDIVLNVVTMFFCHLLYSLSQMNYQMS